MLPPKTALALLLLTSMTSAGDFHGRHALAGNYLGARHGLIARQEDDNPESGAPEINQTSAAPALETSTPAQPTTSADLPTTSDEPTPDPTTAPPQPSTAQDPTTAPTTPPASTPTKEPSKTAPETADEPQEQSTVTRKATSQAPIQTEPPKVTSKPAEPTTLFGTQEYTTIIITKGADGVDQTSTKVQQTLVPTATAAPIDQTPKTESGMSKQTKTTVIGVVCGVGGAILLAAVFFLWWKWSSRRKQRAAIDDGDELVGMNAFQPSGMGSHSEKSHTAGGGQGGLFKDNLESYHAPVNQRPANAGTNF